MSGSAPKANTKSTAGSAAKTATQAFHERVCRIIKRIPRGRVATYGQIATIAGDARGARQVARALHSSSRKLKLPWHRVINSRGKISLPLGAGYELQCSLLESEGIVFGLNDVINLKRFQWAPRAKKTK